MARFDANLSILFTDLPFLGRFEAAAARGFQAVEFWWPPATALDGLTLPAFAKHVRATGLAVELMNFDAGNMAAGDRGLASDPQRVAAFQANVPVAIELAGRLGCRKLNALAGNAPPGEPREKRLDLLAQNLAFAAEAAGRAGMQVMLEALNPMDTPYYLVPNTAAALETIRRVGRPNLRYQLDVYHVAMAGEDPVQAIALAAGRIGHVQLADVPGRHEPGTGRLPFGEIMQALAASGYDGCIGLEYLPTDPAARDFSFLDRLGGRLETRA